MNIHSNPPSSRNVFGGPLQSCSRDPMTGFYRDGCCNTGPEDLGLHVVCVVVTEAFLQFSMNRGNDLATPRPEFDFRGLREGDRWCLCAERWLEAHNAGCAPNVDLNATHQTALAIIPLPTLQEFSV